jgi:hypothetical protein
MLFAAFGSSQSHWREYKTYGARRDMNREKPLYPKRVVVHAVPPWCSKEDDVSVEHLPVEGTN